MDLLNGLRFAIHGGDCIPHMLRDMPESSVDVSIFSPPFPSMYAYTDSEADIGNVDQLGSESKLHFSYFFAGLNRVLKPGRVAVVHCMQIPRMKRMGQQGLFDFRGMLIRLAERAGLIWEYEWIVPKNPQSQAIRTKSRELQFNGLESDRANQRGSLPDHLLKFRKPGDNAIPIDDPYQVSRDQWIQWAEAAWYGIRETDTLNSIKGDNDTKHICPLQLSVIDRLVRLYSREGEIVFSPFAGIGSEGYVSLRLGRRFYGCELKREYLEQADRNLRKQSAEQSKQCELFA